MTLNVNNNDRVNTDSELQNLEKLVKQQQYDAAIASAKSILLPAPTLKEALYLLAVSQRLSNQPNEALETLAALERWHPQFTRLHQERGYCFVAQRRASEAIASFVRAVNMNPALSSSWNMLTQLYRLTGDNKNELLAASQVRHIESLPTEVVTATALFSDGELVAAEEIARAYLLDHGDHIEAMRLLARIGIERDVLDDAELILNSVLAISPEYHLARNDLARCLLKRQKYDQALEELTRLLRSDPANFQYRVTQAAALIGLGHIERALAVYRDLVQQRPGSADLHLAIGHALKTTGRQTSAIDAYRAAALAQPYYGEAYWSLANLKTYRFTQEEIDRMREGEARAETAEVDRYHLAFALGKAYEDSGNYEESFRYYERGNELKKAQNSYRPEPIERNTRLQKALCTTEFFAARRNVGAQSNAPIFIVGLPRAGSTLIEQILASHSAVEGTFELAEIPRLVFELQDRQSITSDPSYPRILSELPSEKFSEFGERFLSDTKFYRIGRPHFIDKNPNNFRHIGLIHLMFPNAKIIDARRDPMACCFSNFKQLFATGQDFTYSLEDIARYYLTYADLMNHWETVLPGRILRVQHEDVVNDLETSVRRILDYCSLPFEPACVDFYKTQRNVRTASSEQVRQPIFRDGLDQWKNFDTWLGPLRTALGEIH